MWRGFAKDVGLGTKLVEKVSRMILATISHQPPTDDTDPDLLLFLDTDLSILAARAQVDSEAGDSWAISYPEYSRRIRFEYSHYSDEDYRRGRAAVLKRFLERSRLYFTEFAGVRWEATARENLKREIAELENGS
jgi:predicted metal-dependent HD superfamily phosphohydrolase